MAKRYVDADKLLQELEDRCEDCLADNAEPWCKHNCEYADLLLMIDHAPEPNVAETEVKVREIGYLDCSDALLKMWMDNVLTDGEYNRIMEKLNEREKHNEQTSRR